MSPIQKATTAAERYDVVRSRSRDGRLPPGYPSPQPTAAWPAENVALLERYREWLQRKADLLPLRAHGRQRPGPQPQAPP
jgi:hypothetical protein